MDQVVLDDEHLDHVEQPHIDSRQEEINNIVRLVLPRLPARTLLRFRSVSPHFNAQISSPFTVLSHFLHPRSLSGMFYPTENGICYVSFDSPHSDLPDPSLSYLPEPVTIKASTNGLMCVRGQQKYYITNPTTMKWVELPQPTTEHHDDVAVVVVFDEPAVYNFTGIYRVVCANPVIGVRDLYVFETFSSDEWAWAPLEYHDVGNIVTESGTAVGAVAYWRMIMGTALTENVLSYDPVKKTLNMIQKPNPEILDDWWELGEMDRKLCVMSRSSEEVRVVTMETTNEANTPYWNEKGSFWVGDWVLPIRSQGSGISVMREDEMLVLRDMQGVVISHHEVPNSNTGFVPYISTLVAVRSSDVGTSTEPSISNNDVGFSSDAGTSAEPSVTNNNIILQEDMEDMGDETRN